MVHVNKKNPIPSFKTRHTHTNPLYIKSTIKTSFIFEVRVDGFEGTIRYKTFSIIHDKVLANITV